MKDEDEISSPTCLFLLFLVWKMSAIGTLKKEDKIDVKYKIPHVAQMLSKVFPSMLMFFMCLKILNI